ncbi:MAG TPA: cupin domain-containing protein, partial [Kofleriaceae bacterium]|nr:cupin domain-containing protein [Kofleriaceae bacterium]
MSVAIALLIGIFGIQDSSAQAPGFKRVELQRHDLPVKDHEAVTARGEFQPGAVVARHSHPGEEIGYVVEGELTLEIDGKPPQKLKAGEAFFIPAGTVHAAKNQAKTGATVVSTYLVEKGKP